MARSAKPVVRDLNGLTSKEIAVCIANGEISQKDAEAFVASRAIRKLQRAIDA